MKRLAVALLAVLIGTPGAEAAALGQRACADAEVVGRITGTEYRESSSSLDVLLIINFDVHHVRFGPVRNGPLRINVFSPEALRDDIEISFYLRQLKDKSWWVADCRDR